MRTKHSQLIFGRFALTGDILFILWILYNGMDSGWRATPIQWVVYISLLTLLVVSSLVIHSFNKQLKD